MNRMVVYFLIIMALLLVSFPAMAGSNVRIQVEIEPGLSIDALVTMPMLPDGQAQVIRVERPKLDADSLLKLLAPQSTVVERNDLNTRTILTLENDASLFISGQLMAFSTQLGDVVNQIRVLEYMLNEQALSLPDLTFASREEVIETIQGVLIDLGCENAQCVAAYALSQDWLAQYTEQLIGRKQNANDIEAGRIPIKREWAQADECYWLGFEWMYSNLPVFAKPRQSIAQSEIGNYFAGSSLEVLVSANGIEFFRGEDLLREISREASQPLLTADQVPDLIKERYRNLIVDAPTTVREIALMYVIRRVPYQEDALQLIPAWCCLVSQKYGGDDPYEVEDWIAFDARNGEVLF